MLHMASQLLTIKLPLGNTYTLLNLFHGCVFNLQKNPALRYSPLSNTNPSICGEKSRPMGLYLVQLFGGKTFVSMS